MAVPAWARRNGSSCPVRRRTGRSVSVTILFRVNEPSGIGAWILWTPDGRGVLVEKLTTIRGTGGQDGDVTSELWLVPLDGTTPRKIDIDLTGAVRGGQGRMQLSPGDAGPVNREATEP